MEVARRVPRMTTPAWLYRLLAKWMLLLLAVNLAGCGSGSGMTDAERVKQSDFHRIQMTQTEAVNQLKQSGGDVAEKRYPLGDAWSVKLVGASVTDATFDQLQTLGRIAELDLSKSNLTDEHMPRLAEVAGVCFRLNLSGTAVTDKGLEALADLPFLMELDVRGTKVTSAAAAQFKSARQANPKVHERAKKGSKVTI
jgi:hypothetical protein